MNISTIYNRTTSQAADFLKLDIRYFIKGSFYAFIQQVIGVGSGLLVLYFFGHFVSKQIFGEYNLILSYLGMFTFLSLPGIDLALPHSVSLGFDKSLITTQRKKFFTSLTGIPILLIFSLYYVYIKPIPSVALTLIIAAISFPFIYSFTNYSSFLLAKKQFKLLAKIASLNSIFFLICIALAAVFKPTTLWLTTAYLIGTIIPAFIGFKISKGLVRKKSKADPNLTKYGSFLTVLSILPWISGNIGGILLANSLGAESLALFAVASRFLTSVQKNFSVFYKPAAAKLAEQSAKVHRVTLFKHWWKLLIIGLLLFILFWLTIPFLITFFMTDAYSDAISYARFLGLTLIPLPINMLVTDMIVFEKLKVPQVYMSTVPQVVKIILYLLIIPYFGISGLVGIIVLERFIEPLIPIFTLLKTSKK